MTNQLEELIAEMKIESANSGGMFLHRPDISMLIAALEQSEANATRLRVERDALREQELHKATNTRAAADIYFQLIEECEIPPGGSLVQHVDSLKERIAELEASKLAVKLPPRIVDIHLRSPLEVEDMWIARFTQASNVADKLQDSAFRHGLQHGFSYGQTNDQEGFELAMKAYSNISDDITDQGEE